MHRGEEGDPNVFNKYQGNIANVVEVEGETGHVLSTLEFEAESHQRK